jgi:hypothetical protein
MKIDKPTDADKDYFRSVFDDRPELEVKPMFGNLAAFVVSNQQMCAGLFGSNVGVRLSEEQRSELRTEKGAGDFGPADRPMKEYVALPPAWRGDSAKTEAWVDRAIAHTTTLALKKKRKN